MPLHIHTEREADLFRERFLVVQLESFTHKKSERRKGRLKPLRLFFACEENFFKNRNALPILEPFHHVQTQTIRRRIVHPLVRN